MSGAIVFVDDEPGLCRVLGRVLRRTGREVVTFTDPAAALAHIIASPPALVVSDFRMPGMTGVELAESIAARGLSVPFILISGDLAVRDATREVVALVEVLEKPVNPEKLLDAVQPLLAA